MDFEYFLWIYYSLKITRIDFVYRLFIPVFGDDIWWRSRVTLGNYVSYRVSVLNSSWHAALLAVRNYTCAMQQPWPCQIANLNTSGWGAPNRSLNAKRRNVGCRLRNFLNEKLMVTWLYNWGAKNDAWLSCKYL